MNELPKAATTLKEIRAVCRPQPLRGAALDAFWVDTGQARDRNRCLRERLREVLVEGDQRLLVYGHRGCGKSTELEKLVRELGDRWFTVRFSVREDLPPVGVRAEDVLLVLAGQVLARAAESGLPVTEKLLEPVLAYFRKVQMQVSKERNAGIECGAGAGTEGAPGLLGSLVKLLVDVRAQIKYNSRQQETIVSELRRTPSQLVHAVNDVIEAVRQSLPQGNRLLVIVEDLDKIGLADARDVFVLNHKLLSGITSAVIYTLPLFTFHSHHEAAELRASFDGAFCLPMIKVDEPDGTRADGFEVIREVIHRRIDPALIQSDALDVLIAKTGGVLRHVFEVLSNVVLLSTLRQPPIRKEHIRAELDHFKAELATQISLPTWEKIPGVESIEQLRTALCRYRKLRAEGKSCPVVADPAVRMLLQAEALIKYNGKGWLGVHPLVEEHLDEIGFS